ncbi:MAG: bile acid:sodium symporter family protein [Methanolobus sp.]|uniref:bile acid:sodium symporter family protein n=1 Tax=Methanolobus sp. TaxID=1874737 RepID=UPI002731C735|nr:bile acid:sodium symporter [Methanolobus sp.]MDP2217671.1 bile acid:sodium symporter family protein [Methanolobus sp.]
MVETVSFAEFLGTIGVLATVIFVLTSMLAMGFSLTLQQIIKPLKNTRLLILTLVANFVLVPLLSLLILFVIPLSEGLSIGLVLIGTAAGAPFLPKLAQVAKGDPAFAVGMMVLLMVVTIVYVPIILPFLLTGVTVDPWAIARSLIFLMLIPLAIALLVRARYEEIANGLIPLMTQATNLSLLVLVVAFFVVYFNDLIGVMVMILVVGLAGLILLMFVSGEMGKHAKDIENINPEVTGV